MVTAFLSATRVLRWLHQHIANVELLSNAGDTYFVRWGWWFLEDTTRFSPWTDDLLEFDMSNMRIPQLVLNLIYPA